MSKYIIELKDDVQVVQKVGVTENGNAFVMNFYKDQLEELTADYINEHYGSLQDDAYQRGLEDGKKATFGLVADAFNADYQKGFEDGKAQSELGCEGCKYENCTSGREPCFRCARNANDYWTAKQTDDEIKVGDEVAFHHDDGRPDTVVVVTYIGQDGFIDGMDGRGTQYAHKNPTKWTKTGRHFDISSILKEMQS